MFQVTITKADLWGNAKDGFDNNGDSTIAHFGVDKEPSKKMLLKFARDEFSGRHFALSENTGRFIGKRSKCLTLDWQDSYNGLLLYEIHYMGQYMGMIEVKTED